MADSVDLTLVFNYFMIYTTWLTTRTLLKGIDTYSLYDKYFVVSTLV